MSPRASFDVRQVMVEPHTARAFNDAEWRDAVVIVRQGSIELEGQAGSRRTFGCGDILWLAGLRIRAIRNRWPNPAVLAAISRRCN